MDVSQESVRRRCQDRAALQDFSLRIRPFVQEPGEREKLTVFHLKTLWLFDLAVPLPLVESIGGNQAVLRLERVAERGRGQNRLDSGIDRPEPDARVLCPGRIPLANSFGTG
jgi:hypothetical protein